MRRPVLTTEQAWSLEQLYDAREVHGYQCFVSRIGRAQVLADRKPIGSPRPELWLRLVALGMVEGMHGELRVTPAGRRFVEGRRSSSSRKQDADPAIACNKSAPLSLKNLPDSQSRRPADVPALLEPMDGSI